MTTGPRLLGKLVVLLATGTLAVSGQGAASTFKQLDRFSLIEEPQLSFDSKPKSSYRVQEGKSLKLSCAVTAIPPAAIKWFKDGNELEQNGADHQDRNEAEKFSNFGIRSLQLGSTKSQMVIDCLDKSKVGVYSCIAENGYSVISANASVQLADTDSTSSQCGGKKRDRMSRLFRPSPARISMVTDMRMEVSPASAELFCRASGWPIPEVIWYTFDNVEDEENLGDQKTIKTDEHHLILNNGDLLVRAGSLSDKATGTGFYKCVARNPLGEDSAVITLVLLDEK